MKANLSNAACGMLDYAPFPFGAIAAAHLNYSVVPLALYIPLFRCLFGAQSQSSALGLLDTVGGVR